MKEIIKKIQTLKEQKNAVILAHYYTRPEIQEVADFIGDSLGLSQQVSKSDAKIILFCGVHFMAETASIICRDKKVIIPDPTAGCSLAESVTGYELKKWKEEHPDGVVVSYINTTAQTKAYTDICCTSANALKVVKSIPPEKEIFFVPDINLGSYIQTVTGRKLHLWDGNCCVHHRITTEMVMESAAKYPDAEILLHPECRCAGDQKVINLPNAYFYSTAGMINHVKSSECKKFVIATELGIMHKLVEAAPDKEFIPMCDKLICAQMKKITIEKVLDALENETHVVTVSESLADIAAKSIQRMLEI